MSSTPESDRPEVAAALDHDTEYASSRIIIEGALIGAALGCGAGFLFGGKARDCLIGGAIGGAGGAVAGAAVAEGNERQIVAEDKEDELYAALQSEGEDLRLYNQKVERAVSRLRQDLTTLEEERRTAQISAEQYEARRASIKRDSQALVQHTQDSRSTIEERNAKLEEYALAERTEKQKEVNLAIVFENAELAQDFDREMET